MSSDGVSSELFFWVCFLNSPEMTVDNMGASVHLSPGKTFCQLFPRTTFFSYIGHMLKVVTSKGIVPSSDCSYGVLICTYVCCYSSLLIMEFSLNDCGIGANGFFYFFPLCGAVRDNIAMLETSVAQRWLRCCVFGHCHPAPCARAFVNLTYLADEFFLTELLTVDFLISAILCPTVGPQQYILLLVISFSIFFSLLESLDSQSSQWPNFQLN